MQVAAATIRERRLFRSALAQVRLLFESGIYSRAASIRSYTVYMYLREDVVQIIYTPLEASAVGIREVHGCTPIHDQLHDGSIT